MIASDHRITLLIPVTAILLGYLVLGETIALREIIGALVIGSALLVIDGRVFRLVRGAASPSTSR
jgi:drug/metabolite transporter (DMT)-like permease